ncbi:unnamed protein product [Rotaria magnacalcarata]|uniref:Non-specific serine/threonine protein kinase n=1 Tax=Rotaria magnacalcarata TaxID=392030 RepID=A0A816LTP1_9BILA|nr:unnamed protein product [Rotaria magnacalcarata]CAF1960819.1 unnamed protein product [Rotaria magnacalcarata]CAF3775403.1 unnamed protein product [Rotaria magnacalcarata]CAF4035824.1 unnamed protein product [Rotaria magnacalcarata]
MATPYNNNEEVDGISSGNIHNATCDSCRSRRIYSDRYKCLQCDDYDLCGHCFEGRCQTKSHSSDHAMVHFKIPNELFGQYFPNPSEVTLGKLTELFSNKKHNIKCSGCSVEIVGVRFKCDICHNYNLCSKCMQRGVVSKNHQQTHPLVVASSQSLLKVDINDIVKKEELGRGAFGQVYRAVWLSKKREVACKVIQVAAHRHHLEESFRKELDAYAELSGAYILKTFGYGERRMVNGSKECFLITEFMHRGSLANVIHNNIEKISLRRKLTMACHVASGMRKLHGHTMIHRDIRPDNILVSSNYTAKIGDMGIAHVFDPNEKHTLMGCMPFMPPEFHRGDGDYDQSLDVFTFGLTLNELFTEKLHRFIQPTKRIQISEESSIFFDLITRCINDESSQRPTATEIEDILNKYRLAADKYINEKHPNYTSQTLAVKDAIFIKFYNEHHKLQQEEPKQIYVLPPKPHFSSTLVREYFDDMMKQFNNIRHHIDVRRSKHQQPIPQNVKGLKYFDNGCMNDHDQRKKLEPIKIDQRPPRCPSPPSDFLRLPMENHQQFLNKVQHKRSRTPTPMSPNFDNQVHQQHFFRRIDQVRCISANNMINQHHIEMNWNADFDQKFPDFQQMRREFK